MKKRNIKNSLGLIYKKSKNSNDLKELINLVNQVVKIHSAWQKEIKNKEKIKDFSPVENIDFNDYYYDFENIIEKIYFAVKDKYHDLHFDKYQFNAY